MVISVQQPNQLSAVNRLIKFPVGYQVVTTLAVHCEGDVSSAAVGILQCVERPGCVYSIMP